MRVKNKCTIVFLVALLSSAIVFAQPITESFNDTLFPPVGWQTVRVSGSATPGVWQRITNGNNPTATPRSGAGMAYYNAYSWPTGNTSDLISPVLDFSTGSFTVQFWMYRDNGFDTRTDKVEVYVNTTNSSTGGTLLGTINRSRTLSPTTALNGWFQYTFSIPSNFNSTTNYIIFKGISGFGNRIYIDDVSIFSNIFTPAPSSITASLTNICAGDSVTLEANGSVGTVYWYSGSCGTNLLGTGNTIKVAPSQTTTYFARNFDNSTFSACASQQINVNPLYNNTFNASICQGSSYQLPDGSFTNIAGNYKDTLTSFFGCDSIVEINLTVQSVVTSNISESICAGSFYFFNGQNLTQPGSYADTLTAQAGCDSIISLALTLINPVTLILNESICEGDTFTFNNLALTASGIYFDTLTAQSGCDSILSLNLTVNSLPIVNIIENTGILETDNNNLVSYQWYLDGNLLQNAQSNSYTPSVNGLYTVEVIDANGCRAVSAPYNYTIVSIEKKNENAISIYPNPSKNSFIIDTKTSIDKLIIVNIDGKIIFSANTVNENIDAALWNSGVYSVLIYFSDGSFTARQILKH